MDHQTPFIGLGNNPEGPDLPIGLGMRLAQDPDALDGFGLLNNERRERLISYIQSGATGEDAQLRIERALDALRHGVDPDLLR